MRRFCNNKNNNDDSNNNNNNNDSNNHIYNYHNNSKNKNNSMALVMCTLPNVFRVSVWTVGLASAVPKIWLVRGGEGLIPNSHKT